MSASIAKRTVWSRLLGLFKAPEHRPVEVAAHLRSITPESAARLMGPGSVPPRAVQMDVPAVISPALVHKSVPHDEDASRVLPWPLLRATGAYQAEHLKTERALALSTAELVAKLDEPNAEAPGLQATKARAPARNLAGQLAVIARFNQPAARAPRLSSIKASALQSQAKHPLVKSRNSTSHRGALTANAKTAITDGHGRPQAIVIDLAAVKKLRRAGLAKRAA